MAEPPSPSPYAPGIISEQRAPPRPAGRAAAFLTATFAMSLVSSTPFWFQWARRATLISGGVRSMLALFTSTATVAGTLILVWAYLSDRVAVWGTRREGYLLLAGLTMAITWLALAFLGRHDVVWLVAAVEFGVASSVSRAAVAGGLAEIGQRRAATGRLAAANVGLARAASLGAVPLAAALASLPLPVTAGIAAGLSLAVVVVIITLADDSTPPPATADVATVTIPKFLRSRTFWSSAAFLAIAGLAMVPREILLWHSPWPSTESTRVPTSFWRMWIEPAATLAAAIGYLLLCRWISLRNMLRSGLFAVALALIALRGATMSGPGALDGARVVLAACDGIVMIGFFDLALRAAPRGREAFGTILLGGIPVFFANLVDAIAKFLPAPGSVTWFAAGAAITGGFAVSLLPPAMVGPRDGEWAPSQ